MKIIGLTGGIGSGKSTVASLFESKGVPVYYSDDEAKFLMEHSPILKEKIKKEFGQGAFINEQLNRSYLAGIVFGNKKELLKLNSIVHPAVKVHFKEWIEKQNATYVIQENPLIFENQNQDDFDQIILVTAPLEERINRVMQRDGSDKISVLNRIKNQLSDDEKKSSSHFIIDNLKLDETVVQVAAIHKTLTA